MTPGSPLSMTSTWVARSDGGQLALFGKMELATTSGTVTCRPVFQLVTDVCRRLPPGECRGYLWCERRADRARGPHLVGVPPGRVLRLSGIEQQSDATQIVRAIGQLYALTGSLDTPGGNVLLPQHLHERDCG